MSETKNYTSVREMVHDISGSDSEVARDFDNRTFHARLDEVRSLYKSAFKENAKLRSDLAAVAAERDAIKNDFDILKKATCTPATAPATPDPGEGWRLLNIGESVLEGDECFDKFGHVWRATSYAGIRTVEHCHFPYRRRLQYRPVTAADYGKEVEVRCGDNSFAKAVLRYIDQTPVVTWYFASKEDNSCGWYMQFQIRQES